MHPLIRIAAVMLLAVGAAGARADVTAVDAGIRELLAAFIQPGEPGCTVGVARAGALSHAQAAGLADIEREKPLDSRSVVNLASVSKQFTAFALLLLEQDGKLSLDDPLVRHVPELAASARGVTLRHLVHHTGGLRDYIGLITMRGREAADGSTIHESLQALARQMRPNAAPGVEFEYSNTGYFLLGVVIARASGQSLAQFTEERIFRPLGMRSTRIVDRYPDGIAALARGYAKTAAGFVVDETGWEQVGDGQVHSDLHDLALWADNFRTGKLGGKELVGRMHAVGVLNSGDSLDYAAGLRIDDTRGLRLVGHGGSWVGYRSQLLRVPSEEVAVIALCNRDDADTWELATAVAALVVGDRLGPVPAETDEEADPANGAGSGWQPEELARFAGTYRSAEANAECRIHHVDGVLVLEGCAQGARLKPGAAGAFQDEEESFTLTFPDGGARVDGFVYDTFGLRGLPFERADAATLIVNASLVDGTGAPARPGAVRIRGERIVAVGELAAGSGDRVVDAGGLTLAPGFIDTHSHHDRGLFEERTALAALSQGITTIVVGQDGSMEFPVAELFERQAETPAAINVATYVGHGDLRSAVMGEDFRRHATPEEIARMRALLAEGMAAGALGLATGLEYDPGIYAATGEVIELAREAARSGGRYISHIRSEDRYFWAAVDEILRIGREAAIPIQISHMKLAMVDWWGQSKRFLDILDAARADGVDVTGDVYPYEYWQSTLTVLFPQRDFTNREAAEFALASISPPDGLLISEFSPEPGLAGKTLAQIATLKGLDPPAALMDLIARSQVEGAEEGVIGTSMRPDDIAALVAWPHANVCSDGSLAGRHPRGTGAFTRVLRTYVREQRLLSLEQAIHKMSGLSAAHVGIADRGTIRPGAYADLVLFDPATVADRSTTEAPGQLSVGIHKVWVNGTLAFADGKATGAFPGQGVKRP